MKIARTCARVGAVASSVLLFGGYVWLKSGGSYASALSATEGEEHRIFAEDQGPPPALEREPEPEPLPPGYENERSRWEPLPGSKSGGPLWISEKSAEEREESKTESTHQEKDRILMPGSKSPGLYKKSKELYEQEKPRTLMSGSKSTFSAVNAPEYVLGAVPDTNAHTKGGHFKPPIPPPRNTIMSSSKFSPVIESLRESIPTAPPQPVDWLALPARREPEDPTTKATPNVHVAAASAAGGLVAGRAGPSPARQFIAETLSEMWSVEPDFPHEPPPDPESKHFIPATQSEELGPRLGRLWKPLTIAPKPRIRQPLPVEPEHEHDTREIFYSSKSGPIVPSPYRTWLSFAHLFSEASKESIKPVETDEASPTTEP